MITDPIQTRRAWLTWQRPLGRTEGPHDKFAVAELAQVDGGVDFRHLDDRTLKDARDAGFASYPALPIEAESFSPELALDVLIRRLPPRRRPDFPDLMETFGLDPNARFSCQGGAASPT